MKKLIENRKKVSVKAFTLLEMLIVLLVISVLMLLFIPNLSKQKDEITQKGNAAVVKVVESQAELYELNKGKYPTLGELLAEKDINEKQVKAYKDYYAKHKEPPRKVQD